MEHSSTDFFAVEVIPKMCDNGFGSIIIFFTLIYFPRVQKKVISQPEKEGGE
jgi:hypothetical protein